MAVIKGKPATAAETTKYHEGLKTGAVPEGFVLAGDTLYHRDTKAEAKRDEEIAKIRDTEAKRREEAATGKAAATTATT